MRFQPKRRASMDHRPGPNIARAAPAVPSNSQTDRSPGSISIFQISISATEVPAMGVHKPAIRRIPAPIESTAAIVTFVGGSLQSLELARTSSAEPTTTRMRSRPMPGQPPANVEYKRRNNNTLCEHYQLTIWPGRAEAPKRVAIVTLSSAATCLEEAS